MDDIERIDELQLSDFDMDTSHIEVPTPGPLSEVNLDRMVGDFFGTLDARESA